MSPDLKAKDLFIQFKLYANGMNRFGLESNEALIKNAKACAIICCDEIIEDHKNNAYLEDWKDNLIQYWQQVKTEIQKL